MRPLSIVAATALGLALASSLAAAQPLQPGTIVGASPRPKSYQLKLNDVASLRAVNGAQAMIQFTNFAGGASYRFRYLPPGGGGEQRGGGTVRESYERVKRPDGSTRTVYRPDHNVKVVAGDISFPWSAGSATMGWIYLIPQKVQVEILGPTAFDRPW